MVLFIGGLLAGLLLGATFVYMSCYGMVSKLKMNHFAELSLLREQLRAAQEQGGLLEIRVIHEPRGNSQYMRLYSLPRHKTMDALKHAALLHRRGDGFSVRSMSDVVTRSEFEKLRDELLARGVLEWRDLNNVNAGLEWSETGKAILTHFGNGRH